MSILNLALASDLKTYGKNHPYVARDWNNLGVAYSELGKYEKAIEYFKLALVSDLNTFGENHPKIEMRRLNLGTAYQSLGQNEKANNYLRLLKQKSF